MFGTRNKQHSDWERKYALFNVEIKWRSATVINWAMIERDNIACIAKQ